MEEPNVRNGRTCSYINFPSKPQVRNMRQLIPLIVLFWPFLVCRGQVQITETYPAGPSTKLEMLETNLSTIILKATSEIGSLSVGSALVSVRCREIRDIGSGRKEQGIVVALAETGQNKDSVVIDYDEINSLQSAFDYLVNLNFSITPLNVFDATFTTRGGLRIAAFGRQRTGSIQITVQGVRSNLPPIILPRAEVARFVGLIDEAKKRLDSVRGG
jgi:hypothetical protein